MSHTPNDLDVFARTLYGEAACEYERVGIAAFMAVGNVILNRLKFPNRFGATIAGVCQRPLQFSCWNEKDNMRRVITDTKTLAKDPLFRVCNEVVDGLVNKGWPDLTKGADHYHADYCRPKWMNAQKLCVRLGKHLFYKLG
jgi:spore germination cell wall hydrolase CwlJ-like protein